MAATLTATSRIEARTGHRRADIQGLRAVAVAGVIAYHLLGWPSGGFLGVDVFFVVSGFVITGLLLRERGGAGRTSLAAFWARRVRRIVPLALVVIGAVVVAVPWFYAPARVATIRTDGVWATLFAANWHFAADATDYFSLGNAPSPLQHFWSLAVEEQYYLVWPLLFVLALAMARGGARGAVAALAAVVGLASIGWAVAQSSSDATTAYYSTLTRAWELAVGAGLATISLYAAQLAAAARTLLSWAGLAVLGAAFVLVTSETGAPWPAAVGAVVGTALVLVAGIGGPVRGAVVLTNPVSRYLGDISYGLYLWHFPLVVMARVVLATSAATTKAVAAVATLVLAVVSYHLLERPILDAPGLGAARVVARGAESIPDPPAMTWGGWWAAKRRGMVGAAVALAVVVSGVAGVATARPALFAGSGEATLGTEAAPDPGDEPSAEPTSTPTTTAPTPSTSAPTTVPTSAPPVEWAPIPLGATGTRIQNGLRGALDSTSWPDNLNPSPGEWETTADQRPEMRECGATKAFTPSACTFGNPNGPEIIVYGDSLGFPLLATVEKAYGAKYKIRGLTKIACAVNGVDANFGRDDWAIPCIKHREMTLDYVRQRKPAVLIMIETYSWATRLKSKATGSASAAEWLAADQRFIDQVKGSVGKVVLVGASIPGVAFLDCYRPGGSPRACVTGIPSWWSRTRDVEKRVHDASFIDTTHWYCVDGRCPIFTATSGTVLKGDYLHTSVQYARQVAPDFAYLMRQSGVLP